MRAMPAPHPPPSPAPASSTPSRWVQQRGRVEAPAIDQQHFRPYRRRLSQVDRLLRDGAISAVEWRAATHYRDCFEFAFGPALKARLPDGTAMRCALHVRSPNWRLRSVCRPCRSRIALPTVEPKPAFPDTRICAFCSWSAPMGRRVPIARPVRRAWRLSQSATTSTASSTLVSSLSGTPSAPCIETKARALSRHS